MAWLERLASSLDDKTNKNKKLPKNAQENIDKIKQDYRQLRYGKLSSLDANDQEYQQVLKQFKRKVRSLL